MNILTESKKDKDILMEKYNIEQLLRDGNAVQFHPLGSSMWPLFVYPKDEAIVVPVEPGRFKRGDVCLYRGLSGNLIIHRVYKRKGNMLYMVGDHQTEIEGPIESKDALGIMTHYIRNGKKHVSLAAVLLQHRRFSIHHQAAAQLPTPVRSHLTAV